jgi:hypothetical protein
MKLTLIAAIAATVAAVALSTSGASALSCKGGCPPGPFNPGGLGKSGGSAAAYTHESCGSELSYMRRVHAEEIGALGDDDRITISPICEGDDFGPLSASGNAGVLRKPIGLNPVLVAALAKVDYTSADVVGVRLTQNGAILYVSHSDY